jgi:hypothetical protein
MVSKFNVGDMVTYDNKLFRVVKIYAANWELTSPFVYGLALVQSDPREPVDGKLMSVREALLVAVPAQAEGVWEVLYGKKEGST